MESDREQRIRERAYEIWEREGRPQGRAAEHWARAAGEIAAETEGEPEAVSVAEGPAKTRSDGTTTPEKPARRSRAVPKREAGEKRR